MAKPLGVTGLIYKEEYIHAMMDDKNAIAEDISEYFVFQTLRLNTSKEYARGKCKW